MSGLACLPDPIWLVCLPAEGFACRSVGNPEVWLLCCVWCAQLQGAPGVLASTVASALGVDRAGLSAAAAARWGVVFSPLLEYVALLTGAGRWAFWPGFSSCSV